MATNKNLRIENLENRAMLAADIGSVFGRASDPKDDPPAEFASFDGTGNNLEQPELGSTNQPLLRLSTVQYGDGISAPGGEDRPSAREVSNSVVSQVGSVENDRFLTDLAWLWGQFVDHDIDLTGSATGADGNPAESFDIAVPLGDPYFDPLGTGTATIGLHRSAYDAATGDSVDSPRQQINQITAFLDGSVVYGSDQERADALRTFEGGQLILSEDGLLPFNEAGLANANPGLPDSALFLAGDVRANENVALTAMHTLWVREHNRIAGELAARDPSLTDEQLYQQARQIVTAELQAITYNEFLPALVGYGTISSYQGYDPNVDPSIANIFSTAAYRFGHSMLSSELPRLNNDGSVIEAGNLSLSEAFFAPGELVDHGIESILLGAASQQAQEIDTRVVDDVRNFLFGPPGAGGFDLASLNIQRGRDHGLADYNQTRIDVGLAPVTNFSEITSDPALAAELESLYGSVDNIDVWVGGLAEDHLPGSSLGELFTTVIVDQFQRIRDGDRFWYQNVFSGQQLRRIDQTTLADVIERNTEISGLRENVFYDDSVLFVQADGRRDGGDGGEMTVVVDDQSVRVVQNGSRRSSESRDIADVAQIMVVGADGRRDRVTIDLQSSDASLLGGIVVFGGDRDGDTLSLRGTREADTVVVDGRRVYMNSVTIDQAGFEMIEILASPRDDVQIVDDGGSDVVIVDGQRQDPPPRDGDGGGRRDRRPVPPGEQPQRSGDADNGPTRRDRDRAAQPREDDPPVDLPNDSLPVTLAGQDFDETIDAIARDSAGRRRGPGR